MDLSVIVSHIQTFASTVLGAFALLAIGDDALDLALYVKKGGKISAQAIAAVVLQDVGTRAFLAVFVTGLIAALATGNDPVRSGLAAAAVAAGVSTIALKNDFQAKLTRAFPDFVGSLLRPIGVSIPK